MWPTIAMFFGIILGWALNQRGLERLENRREDKKSKSVKTLIEAEINQNRWRLRQYWDEVLEAGDMDRIPKKLTTEQLKDRLEKTSMPNCRREILESQLPFLSNAYDENGIQRILSTHDAFERISKCIDGFAGTLNDKRAENLRGILEMEISEILTEGGK